MRKLFLLCIMVVLALGVSAVAAQDDLSAVDPSGQTVVYWHQFSGAQLETMTALVESFNSTNEYGITVEALAQGSYGDIRELMNAAIVSGELPNIVAGYANDAASYELDGVVADLNPYLNDPTWGLGEAALADFNTDLLTFNSPAAEPYNGALLAWPHQSSAQVLVINLSLLAELGYDAPPATWEEFREIACAAANSTGPNGEDRQGFPVTTDASVFETLVASNGGAIFDGSAYDFQSEASLAALNLYADLYSNGCAYIPSERFIEQTEFALGLNPFFVSSTAGLTFIAQAYTDNNATFDWTWTTLPSSSPETRTLQVFVPSIIMIESTPEAQLASWLFLKHLVTPENAAAWSGGTGYFNPVPSTSEILGEESFAQPELFSYFASAAALQNDPAVNLYSGPNVPSYGALRGFISEAIANVTSNGIAPEEVAATLQQQADEALAGM
ncbi:MAG: extracellular solute-binding protein [bacterium]|nr:extracellular solute-binding protein [bacterium]